jgi:hypothetical protein
MHVRNEAPKALFLGAALVFLIRTDEPRIAAQLMLRVPFPARRHRQADALGINEPAKRSWLVSAMLAARGRYCTGEGWMNWLTACRPFLGWDAIFEP